MPLCRSAALLALFVVSAQAAPPSTCGSSDTYASALCAYQRRSFAEAEAGFRAIVEKDEADAVTIRAVYFVGRALNTLRPEAELLEELMHRAVGVLDATLGFAFSLDEKLNVQSLYTFDIDTSGDQLLAEAPVRQVIASREPMSVSGRDLLLAPMVAGDVIVGIIGVGGKEERGAKSGSFVDD